MIIMLNSENIHFGLSASDLQAIQHVDKSAVKLAEDSTQAPSKGDFSAWNCPYKECLPRKQ
jgi:hypothetical protein